MPAGATGGGTWSKKPPLSSHVRNTAVLAQRSGLAVIAASTWLTAYWPHSTGVGGCSVQRNCTFTHDTAGSLPAAQSTVKSLGDACDKNAGPANAGFVRNRLKR